MQVRKLEEKDLHELETIHKLHYDKEFEFPDFKSFMSSYVVTGEFGQIVTGGGIRQISETIIITDKDWPIDERRKALIDMLTASAFSASINDIKQLHAFIQDENWLRHLKRFGFKETKGKSLVFNVF